MAKEFIMGIIISIVIFLAYLGYDITPILLLSGLGVIIYFLIEKKGLIKNETVGTNVTKTSLEFNDIGGQSPAKQEIKEALEFMLKLDKAEDMGIRPLKGILLSGPPGTGKTLLAKAAATYTNSVFLSTSGSEFIEMYAGVGAQRVRKIFKSAREQARKLKKTGAIIFIDEIEVLGGKRGSHTSHLEYDQTLNQLLVEMDGMQTGEDVQVLVIGATNRVDLLDDALVRPGRFDRIVKVDLPDKDSRLHILKIHTANKPLLEDLDLEEIARDTFGLSGAHLESVCNEAAIYAMREASQYISQKHFKEAVDKVIMGEKAEKKTSDDEKKRIAYHESGHALISELIRSNSVSYVTITSRGNALGYMRQAPESDLYLYTKEYMEDQIKICLAGAITEEIFLGNKSTGAANDFNQAMKLAKQIIECGLSNLGVVDSNLISKQEIHDEISKILTNQELITKELIITKTEVVNQMVDRLLVEENISGDQLQGLIKESSVRNTEVEVCSA